MPKNEPVIETVGELNIDKLLSALSTIFSNKYNAEVTFTATLKTKEEQEIGEHAERIG